MRKGLLFMCVVVVLAVTIAYLVASGRSFSSIRDVVNRHYTELEGLH